MDKSRCQRCERIPSPIKGPGILHLRLPLNHSFAKLVKHLKALTISYTHKDGLLSIELPTADIQPLVANISVVLSTMEQADSRVIFQPTGSELEFANFFEMDNLENFLAKMQANWLLSMMSEERLTSAFQPIIDFRTGGSLYAYECLLRGSDQGQKVMPAKMFHIARHADLLFQIDLAARKSAVNAAAKFNINSKIFINFTPTAIYDPEFCLRSTLSLIDKLGLRREQIVFEVIETELITDIEHLKNILDYYKKTGFGVALDDVGAGFSSLNLLSILKPDYIKIDIGLISKVDIDAYKAVICQKLIETGKALGITVLAEGIETAGEYQWCKAAGVDLGQGFYIAKPNRAPPVISSLIHL